MVGQRRRLLKYLRNTDIERYRALIAELGALIMRHYLDYYAHKFNKGEITLSEEAAELAAQYAWPGNIRELRNICEQLAVLCEENEISRADLAAALPARYAQKPETPRALPEKAPGDSLREMEKERIREVVSRTASRQEAAELLGISRATLWRKCRELGIT